MLDYFSQFFSSHLFLMVNLFHSNYIYFKKAIFFYILREFSSIFSWFNATVAAYWKHLLSSLIGFMVAFLFLYPIERIYIWSALFQIYFMTFALQQISIIKDKITTSRWCFQTNLISIALWMHFTLFTSVFKTNKVNCYY